MVEGDVIGEGVRDLFIIVDYRFLICRFLICGFFDL